MFLTKFHNLGNVKVGSKHTLEFRYNENITKIREVSTSCGCALAKIDYDKRIIYLTYTAKPIPKHLADEGKTSYQTTKTAKVLFEGTSNPGIQQEETLSFRANVFS